MNRKMVLTAVLCCVAGLTEAQTPDQQQFNAHLDSFTKRLMEKVPVIPAITITIVNENGTVFNKAYGWANKEAGIKADLNTEFYIASSTKSFTAFAAALLDHEKKIMLDSPVKKYFRNVQFSAGIGDDVTMRSLLTHTSGLENGPLTFRAAYTGSVDKKDMLHVLGNATTVKAKPGIYKYDNLGYNIYGLAVEESLDMKWQDVLRDRIFVPLGMKRTSAYVSVAKKNNWPMAVPYTAYGPNGLERLYLEKDDNTMQSAGGLITTASDIALWLQAQINGGKVNNKQVFPAQVVNTVHTGSASYEKGSGMFSSAGQYGLGWFVSKYHDEKIIYHFGGFPGYRAHISFMPGKKVGVAIFVNEGTIGGGVADMIAGFIYDWKTGGNVLEQYSNKIEQLESIHQKETEGVQRSRASRAARVSQLTMPLQTYTGKYRHPYFGDMEVSIENNTLAVRIGNLHAVSTPFTQKESIRVELIPGTGQVVLFKVDDTQKASALVYEGQEFKRVM
jgi:CubicO group peptidase (beta-lactamase class C family)